MSAGVGKLTRLTAGVKADDSVGINWKWRSCDRLVTSNRLHWTCRRLHRNRPNVPFLVTICRSNRRWIEIGQSLEHWRWFVHNVKSTQSSTVDSGRQLMRQCCITVRVSGLSVRLVRIINKYCCVSSTKTPMITLMFCHTSEKYRNVASRHDFRAQNSLHQNILQPRLCPGSR